MRKVRSKVAGPLRVSRIPPSIGRSGPDVHPCHAPAVVLHCSRVGRTRPSGAPERLTRVPLAGALPWPPFLRQEAILVEDCWSYAAGDSSDFLRGSPPMEPKVKPSDTRGETCAVLNGHSNREANPADVTSQRRAPIKALEE